MTVMLAQSLSWTMPEDCLHRPMDDYGSTAYNVSGHLFAPLHMVEMESMVLSSFVLLCYCVVICYFWTFVLRRPILYRELAICGARWLLFELHQCPTCGLRRWICGMCDYGSIRLSCALSPSVGFSLALDIRNVRLWQYPLV